MAFVKFKKPVPAKPAKPMLKLSGTTISIAKAEWEKAGLTGTKEVNLFWDSKIHMVGIASTTEDDPDKFRVREVRPGSGPFLIAAKIFFNEFKLDGAELVDLSLKELDGILAFKVNVPSASPATNGTDAPKTKRRGRFIV